MSTTAPEALAAPSTPRERDAARRAARSAALSAVDFSRGRHRPVVLAQDLKPGMVASRLVYSYLSDLPGFPTDVVVLVEPSTGCVGGVKVTWSDTTSATYGGHEEFTNVWVPFKKT